jgi:hypothetical protein
MLVGTADPDDLLGPRAVEMDRLDTEEVTFERVTILQVLCESDAAAQCEVLPPGLHPTLPPLVGWQAWQVEESPWGPFTLATTRIECRSGVRPRALHVGGFIDNRQAADALARRWGLGLRDAPVLLERRYDEVRCAVAHAGEPVLEIGLRDPMPLGTHDVQYVASLHPARTARGLRLVQCDMRVESDRAERGTPIVDHFDAAAWGEERLRPTWPVSASIAIGRLSLPKLRYVCRPGELAFTGTEPV